MLCCFDALTRSCVVSLKKRRKDGAALDQARRTKERTYPELTGEHGKGQTRGACVRDRRKMVRGVPLVPQAVGPSEGPVGAP